MTIIRDDVLNYKHAAYNEPVETFSTPQAGFYVRMTFRPAEIQNAPPVTK